MFLIFVILSTSSAAMIATWIATGGLDPQGGNALLSFLVPLAVALAWGRSYGALGRAYMHGRFPQVRKKLRLWKAHIGRVEAHLTRLWMAVEAGDANQLDGLIHDAERLGVGTFSRAWAAGHRALLSVDTATATDAFLAGAEKADGLDRAELYCEAAIAFLRDPDSEHNSAAAGYVNKAERLLDRNVRGAGGRQRRAYVRTLCRAARGMTYAVSGQSKKADERFRDVESQARNLATLRGIRLGQLMRIERLLPLYAMSRVLDMEKETQKLQRSVVLPGHRQRLREVLRRIAEEAERREAVEPEQAQMAHASAVSRPAAGLADEALTLDFAD